VEALHRFYATLPERPYCSDVKDYIHIRGAQQAITHSRIQPNGPYQWRWLVFDIDHEPGAIAWVDAGLPPPNLIVSTPPEPGSILLGKAHLLYELENPVCTSPSARRAPITYLQRIEQTYIRCLGADRGYTGLLCKNPLSPQWVTTSPRAEPYTLKELSYGLDLERPIGLEFSDGSALGRNCALFNRLRLWAYHARSHYFCMQEWSIAVAMQAEVLNDFPKPLRLSEVHSTARSVAKWTWRNPGVGIGRSSRIKSLSADEVVERQRAGARHTAELKAQRTHRILSAQMEQAAANGRHLTQRELAACAGVSLSTAKRYWSALVGSRGVTRSAIR